MQNRGSSVLESEAGSTAESDAPTRHLTESQLAGYLEHALSASERGLVEAHLDECAACREEVVAVAGLAASYQSNAEASPASKRSRRRWWPLALGGALAASAAGLLLLRQPAKEPSPVIQSIRAPATDEGRARIEVVAPSTAAADPSSSRTFVWRRSGADSYRFFLLSESADPLWTHETSDTALILPASVSLLPGHDYFWRVDAVGDGLMASTGARLLRIPR